MNNRMYFLIGLILVILIFSGGISADYFTYGIGYGLIGLVLIIVAYKLIFRNKETNELPNIYAGDLNTERISKYRDLTWRYDVDEGVLRDVFNAGADWYKEVLERK